MGRRLAISLCALVALAAAEDPRPAAAKPRCAPAKATKKATRRRTCANAKARAKANVTRPAPARPAPLAAPPVAAVEPPATEPAPVAPAAPAPPPTPDVVPASRVQATTHEFTVTLSRAVIPAGAAIVQLVNRGQDPHDLHVRPAAGGPDVLAIAEAGPGAVADGSATLAAGAYTLYCALPGHEAAGMRATLTVG
jgi:plastocyanin